MDTKLEKQIKLLPKTPGIYKFLNKKGVILYVGKANNLKSRVQSYFKKATDLSGAKLDMINQIHKIETKLTDNETEALVLEAMNIKKHKPKYNITLKDDKDYNFVKIDYTFEYPTVTTIRRPKIDNKKSKIKYFGPFTSGFALQENLQLLRRIFPHHKKNKNLTKFEKDLLQKRSIGPIPQTQEEYLDMIKKLAKVIDGQTSKVKQELKKRMQRLSKGKQFEIAAKVRNQIKWLEIFSIKQKIVTSKEYADQSISSGNREDALDASLEDLKRVLKLKNIPHRIEGYDISNIQGQFSVGSMVVFTDGRPDKNEYRKFKIKTIKGSDDFASLAEVLKRRFKHNNWQTPDLVLLDGGKGQLSAIIKTNNQLPITDNQIIAIAKKHEEIFQGKNIKKIKLDSKSQASYLLQRIRDEAHRFAQKYYHTLHSKSYAKNKIGKKRTKKEKSK